ncbi:MAG: hypothetical protein JXA21_13260 [Anaerolineae bacterium]|nr:hypothetical protein [Anaerolineae bacterium]
MKQLSMLLSVGCLLAVALCGGCANERGLPSTPDPTPTLIPLTEAERAKIDPELLAVIEWEEQHPGEGREVAPEDFLFDGYDQIMCIIVLSDEKVDVTHNSRDREASLEAVRKMVAEYGGTMDYESEYWNEISIMILLKNIKSLTKEEMVVEIQPGRNVRLLDTVP